MNNKLLIFVKLGVLASWWLNFGLASSRADIETIYVVPMSHTDIGFNAPPKDMAESASKSGENAIEEAIKNPDYRWNFETFWQLEQWLIRHKDHAPLLDLIHQGRFGVSASYVCPHTSLMSAWALDQLFRIPTEWGKQNGVMMDWAVIDDVPGHPIDLPKFLVENGVIYLALGVNQSLSKPLPHEVCNTPFWWESPNGSTVLVWISEDAYTDAYMKYGIDPGAAKIFDPKEYGGRKDLDVMKRGIGAMMKRYRERHYAYDAVLALHAFDNWGSVPSRQLPSAAKLWNESVGQPKIVISSPREFFRHVEEKYGKDLPIRRGGFGGQWEGVRIGTPTAMERARAEEERLKALSHPNPAEIEPLLVYWEHSFGMGGPWPDMLTRKQTLDHNCQQYELTEHWPLPKMDWPRGQAIELPPAGKLSSLESNGLYLAKLFFWEPIWTSKLSSKAWLSHGAERLENGTIFVRHKIDRRQLPNDAHVVWTWKLSDEEAKAPIVVKTASGSMRIPGDTLAGYEPDHWIAAEQFQIGSTIFHPHGPFAFFRTGRHSGWLFGRVLDQGLDAEFKGKKKGTLKLEEAYPGEAADYEFSIEIQRQ